MCCWEQTGFSKLITHDSCYFFLTQRWSDEEDTKDGGGEEDKLVDGMAQTLKRRKLVRQDALSLLGSIPSRVQGVVGVADKVDPSNTAFIDFVKLLWPYSLCA